MSTLLEAFNTLNNINEKDENLTKEEIVAKAERAKELYFAEREKLINDASNLLYGEGPFKIKGEVKSFDIHEERKEIRERDPFNYLYRSVWKDVLVNKLVCIKRHDGSEFETTIAEMQENGFDFFKQSSEYTRLPFKLFARWGSLVSLFNSYKKWKEEAAKATYVPPKKKDKRVGFDIDTFDPYNWGDQREVGAAWAEISQHKDWQDWIMDNVKSISARAPEIKGKLKKAKSFLGHDRVYPANTWGWSFAITFDKDKLDECPFKHLLSKSGKLCSVATVCALFKGSSYEGLFTSRDDEEEVEFEEVDDEE